MSVHRFRYTASCVDYEARTGSLDEFECHFEAMQDGPVMLVRQQLAQPASRYLQQLVYRDHRRRLDPKRIKVKFELEEPVPVASSIVRVYGRHMIRGSLGWRAFELTRRPIRIPTPRLLPSHKKASQNRVRALLFKYLKSRRAVASKRKAGRSHKRIGPRQATSKAKLSRTMRPMTLRARAKIKRRQLMTERHVRARHVLHAKSRRSVKSTKRRRLHAKGRRSR